MKCTIMGSAQHQQGSSNKELSPTRKDQTREFNFHCSVKGQKPFQILYFWGNFQIDLNMSCDGAKEEIKNLLDYKKYEDYVDTFICPTDLKFLQV